MYFLNKMYFLNTQSLSVFVSIHLLKNDIVHDQLKIHVREVPYNPTGRGSPWAEWAIVSESIFYCNVLVYHLGPLQALPVSELWFRN